MAPPPRSGARAGYRASLDALASAQKANRGVPLFTLKVNRPAGRRLAAAAHVLGLQPNTVTVLGGVSSIVAVALMVLVAPGPYIGLLIAALFVFGFMLDSADGQLARLRGLSSRSGEWLDHMVDAAVKLFLHIGVLLAWYRLGVDERLLLAPLAYLVVSLLIFFGGTLAGVLREGAAVGAIDDPGGLPSWALVPVDHGVISMAFAVWGWQAGFTVTYVLLLLVNTAYLAAYLLHWYRRLS